MSLLRPAWLFLVWINVLSLVTASSICLSPKTLSLGPGFCERCAVNNICQTDCFAVLHPVAWCCQQLPDPIPVEFLVSRPSYCFALGRTRSVLHLQRHEDDPVTCTHCCSVSPKGWHAPSKPLSPRQRTRGCAAGLPGVECSGEHVHVGTPRFGQTAGGMDQSLRLQCFFQRKMSCSLGCVEMCVEFFCRCGEFLHLHC